jgi:signal transduction histidine kinase/ligand-binding sensor domain-containing protein
MRFLIILTFLICQYSLYANKRAVFSCINKESGLPSNHIRSISQDTRGMIWISTASGVVRYDGMSFKYFRNSIYDTLSVSDQVSCMHLDSSGTMWFGTPLGIQSYNEDTELFSTFKLKDKTVGVFNSYVRRILPYNKDSLLLLSQLDGPLLFPKNGQEPEYLKHTMLRGVFAHSDRFSDMLRDSNGNMLFVTEKNGVYLWLASQAKGLHFLEGTSNINTSALDAQGRFWFPQGNGLAYISPATQQMHSYKINFAKDGYYSNELHYMGFASGKLYLGTIGDGLVVLDTVSGGFMRHRNDPASKTSIPDNGITYIFEDAAGNVWLGTATGGIAVQRKQERAFSHKPIVDKCEFSRCNFVNSYAVTGDGTHWAAMDGAGLFYKRQGQENFTSVLNFCGEPVYGVTSLTPGADGSIWVGTHKHGLFNLSYDMRILSHYSTVIAPFHGLRLRSNFIKKVHLASDGKIWVATSGGGVAVIDEGKRKIKILEVDPADTGNSLTCSHASVFLEENSRIWIGTYWGLNLFDLEANMLGKWVNEDLKPNALSSNVIYDIVQDSAGTLWLATGHGINYYSPSTGKFGYLGEESGLVNNTVMQLQIDSNGDIWASTIDGLSKYGIDEKRFYSFHLHNGLPSSTFREASFQDSSGMLYFGTDKGIIYFLPDKVKIDTLKPAILITEFKLDNERIMPGKGSVLEKSIFNTNSIILNHKQNYIGFEFSALNFVDFEKAKFRYRLAGADRDWIETDASRRYADYSKLDPGNYIFQVHGTNNDGVWSENPAEIRIKIVPPFYATALFRFFAIVASLSLLVIVIRLRDRKFFGDKQRLEASVAERTKIIEQKNKEINEQNARLLILNNTKDRFFTIIAHDLKNPLNALMGFSGLLNDRYNELPDEKKKKFISVINDSSRSMYSLLINLLDWSRSQMGTIPFQPSIHNLQPIIDESVSLLMPQAEQKGIVMLNRVSTNYKIFADINMLKTTLRNLISNSIKFSFRNDTVEIGVSQVSNSFVTVYIRDNGVGMSDATVGKIFSSASPESTLGTEKEQGSGLGLIICKEFVTQNKGRIWCTSSPGSGTTFFFTMPCHSMRKGIDDSAAAT